MHITLGLNLDNRHWDPYGTPRPCRGCEHWGSDIPETPCPLPTRWALAAEKLTVRLTFNRENLHRVLSQLAAQHGDHNHQPDNEHDHESQQHVLKL